MSANCKLREICRSNCIIGMFYVLRELQKVFICTIFLTQAFQKNVETETLSEKHTNYLPVVGASYKFAEMKCKLNASTTDVQCNFRCWKLSQWFRSGNSFDFSVKILFFIMIGYLRSVKQIYLGGKLWKSSNSNWSRYRTPISDTETSWYDYHIFHVFLN